MSIVLDMLALNVPLARWHEFEENGRAGTVWYGGKTNDNLARAIFRQLSHDDAVEIVAREFNSFPHDLRLLLRTLCNEGNGSGNVRKGVQRLDRLLGGKLLREQQHMEHFQQLTRKGYRAVVVNPAVAGATRKYGIVTKEGKK